MTEKIIKINLKLSLYLLLYVVILLFIVNILYGLIVICIGQIHPVKFHLRWTSKAGFNRGTPVEFPQSGI